MGELRRNDEFMAALRHDQDFLRDCERDEPLMTGPCGPQGEPPLPPGIPLPKVSLLFHSGGAAFILMVVFFFSASWIFCFALAFGYSFVSLAPSCLFECLHFILL